MKRRRIAVVFGTRPEAIKMAPVVLALQRTPGIECEVCVTAQHRQMLDQVLEVFGIRPDADLDLMRAGQTLADFTARALTALDAYLERACPDLVLVQGDTTTVFCATLACFYRRIPVGHVEAGLRTGDLSAPWPEEANRVLTTRLAAMHFAPTTWSRANLRREGVPATAIHVTGNPVIDALRLARARVEAEPVPIPGWEAIERTGASRVVLVTGHRRESFGGGFENICRAIADLAARHRDVAFVYPVHLNPNVREPVNRILGRVRGGRPALPNVHLLEPLSYLPFVSLMARSTLVLTDSGGIQEEAPGLGKPVLVMRETTERPEGVHAGTVRLVGTDRARIVSEVDRLLTDPKAYRRMAERRNPYGDGRAAERIVAACLKFLGISVARGGGVRKGTVPLPRTRRASRARSVPK
ncbi:MAG: UDP-N-acetylglucosamine 2-epimerase (non-hydrolyzing) [Verrucomicrobiales bacterium]|nr:UDP-N-acetylglucosamine 2-epimerase (non-hydrolyzing) [Verrucomicrobiales bacterium]